MFDKFYAVVILLKFARINSKLERSDKDRLTLNMRLKYYLTVDY